MLKIKETSLKTNFIMNAILAMSSCVFPLITFPYISRVLLPEGTGKVTFALSLISYFIMFSQLGIPTYGIRACAKVRDDREKLTRVVHELLIINLIMGVVSYFILFLALMFIPRLRADRTLYSVMSIGIFFTAIGMEWLYKALEQYTYITTRSIVFKVVALAGMFFLVHDKNDYVIYGAISIFASSASNIFNFINVHKFIDFKSVGNYNIKRHIKAIGIFFAMACASTIYTNLDTLMLGFMVTDEAVGYYNAAVRVKTLLVSIITSLGAVLLPRSSYFIEHGLKDRFNQISKKAINFIFLSASPLILYFVFFAEEGIYFLSGTAYEKSIIPMQVIMPTLLFIGSTNIMGIQILVPLGREKVVLYSEIAGAIIDVLINMILIPKYAAVGAAVGTLVAEGIVFMVQLISLGEEIYGAFKSVPYCKIIISLFVGASVTLCVKTINTSYFNILLISSIIFFGLYCGCLLILREENSLEMYNLLKNKFRKCGF